MNADPYVANNISDVANNIDKVILFGKFGDLSTSSRYITADSAFVYDSILISIE